MLHRHDINDEIWKKININLPGSVGHIGRNGVDNRRFINAVFWILRTGAPWRDLLKEYGDWENTHRRVKAKYLIADKWYDSKSIVEFAAK